MPCGGTSTPLSSPRAAPWPRSWASGGRARPPASITRCTCRLRGAPSAALLLGGRPWRGARHRAGALAAVPELDPSAAEGELKAVAGLLADATALLDPQVVVLDAVPQHLERLVALLQQAIDDTAPGPKVAAAALGEEAALLGAVRIASTLAYEGGRTQ